MREFRNGAGKMIVVYDYDESVAARSATTLAQRGYDNVLMLSGGLRQGCQMAIARFQDRM